MHRPSSSVPPAGVLAALTLALGLVAAGPALPVTGQSAVPSGAVPSGSPVTTYPVPEGPFEGTVYQYHQPFGMRYGTTVQLTDCVVGMVCGSTAYPDLGCGGTLTYTGPEAGVRLVFTEDITSGAGCDPVVVLRVVPTGPDTLDVQYYVLGHGVAEATLHRLSGPASPDALASPSASDGG